MNKVPQLKLEYALRDKFVVDFDVISFSLFTDSLERQIFEALRWDLTVKIKHNFRMSIGSQLYEEIYG